MGIAISLLVAIVVLPADARAVPPGRAWTPVERLYEPGFGSLVAPRMDIDPDGTPAMTVIAVYGPAGDDGVGYRWAGDHWARSWWLGQDPLFFWPVVSPPGTRYLVWAGGDAATSPYFYFAQVTGSGVGPAETIATIQPYEVAYSAAVSSRRRWAAIYDYVGVQPQLRAFSSAAPGSWREVPPANIPGNKMGRDGVAVTALNDTTALVAAVHSGQGIMLGMLGDSTWTDTGVQIHSGAENRPRFRPRPSGGQWLAWGTNTSYLLIATFRDGAMSAPETLRWAYRRAPVVFYGSDSPDLSRDLGEYPAVAWGAQFSGLEVLCVSVPTDAGFSLGDEIPGAAGGTPTVARDVNDDVWVSSWDYFDTANWLHTYTIATASRPRIADTVKGRVVSWSLTEPAPETWWAVLRAEGSGEFVPAARVRAGPGLELSWRDPAPQGSQARYKIRRECLDTRYQWESETAAWPTLSRVPVLLGPPTPIIFEEHVTLDVREVEPGPIVLRLYDVQGRVVLEQRAQADSGTLALALDLGGSARRLTSGIYFAQVRDAASRLSNAVRLVILR